MLPEHITLLDDDDEVYMLQELNELEVTDDDEQVVNEILLREQQVQLIRDEVGEVLEDI
jgi:hypothetical protein